MTYPRPKIETTADLVLKATELIGPKTNSKTVGMFHPDMSQSSPDQGRTDMANRAGQRSSWLPGKLLNNTALKHDETDNTDLYGLAGQYMKNEYAKEVSPSADAPTVDPPEDRRLLDIVQSEPNT